MPFHLVIMGSTDVHGRIYPTNYLGEKGDAPVGFARLSTLVEQVRKTYDHTLLVDSGDILQGTALDAFFGKQAPREPNPLVAVMNAMGYDAAAIGNHDYDYGVDALAKDIREAHFPFLSANTYKAGTRQPYWTPYVIQDHWGIKIGFVGFTPPGVALWSRGQVQGRMDFGDIVAAGRQAVAELKHKGADVVVALAHSGLGPPHSPAYTGYLASAGLPPEHAAAELARQVPAIDVIFAGHSHVDVPQVIENGVVITQAGLWGKELALAELDLARSDKGWQVLNKRTYTQTTTSTPPDPRILALAKDAHQRTLAYINTPIGTSSEAWSSRGAYWQDTPLLDLINEVQRRAAGTDLSAASVLNPNAAIPAGQVTLKDIASLYVYENTLTAIRITGKQLREYLEHSARYFNQYPSPQLINPQVPGYNYDVVSGVDYEIDISRPVGRRITRLSYHGKPVTDSQTFTMALNNFRQSGGGGYAMISGAPVVYNKLESIRELLVDYVRRKGAIAPRDVFVQNWRLLPQQAVEQLNRESIAK